MICLLMVEWGCLINFSVRIKALNMTFERSAKFYNKKIVKFYKNWAAINRELNKYETKILAKQKMKNTIPSLI